MRRAYILIVVAVGKRGRALRLGGLHGAESNTLHIQLHRCRSYAWSTAIKQVVFEWRPDDCAARVAQRRCAEKIIAEF